MNSGIRFSVALIVVIMVLLGFYYAGLDDDAVDGTAETVESPAIEVQSTDETLVTGETEETVREPVAVVSEPEVSTPPVVIEPPADPASSSGETTGAADRDSDDDGEPVAEFDEFDADSGASDDMDQAEESDAPERGDESDSIDAEASSDEAEEAPEPIEASSPVEEPASGSESTTSRGGGADSGELVRDPRAAGVGIHRLASIERDQAIANAAMRAIAEADAPGMIEGPAGSFWIPLPPDTRTDLLEGALVDRVSGDDTPHVLVLSDEGNAVDLAGRIASTEVSGSEAGGGWQLRFRVTPEAITPVVIATRSFRNQPVAWIGGGRILAIDRPLIPISGRGNLPVMFPSEDDAAAVARRLESIAPEQGEPDSPTNVVVGAGSLPPDQYTEYVVKVGDTFSSIATAWFGDANKQSLIAQANPYVESSRLRVGQILKLPPKTMQLVVEIPPAPTDGAATTYRVRSGDTLGKIAQAAYGKASLWTRIYEANKAIIGADPGNLKVGMDLEIPR